MNSSESKSPEINPAEIAREAFRQLAVRRIAPTPDAYRKIYNEIVGIQAEDDAENVLHRFATHLTQRQDGAAKHGPKMLEALQAKDWGACENRLAGLANDLATAIRSIAEERTTPAPATRGSSLPTITSDTEQALRDMLVRTLTFTLGSLLQEAPDLADEARAIGIYIAESANGIPLGDAPARLKQLSFKIDIRSGDGAYHRTLMLNLLQLLLENAKELLDDDTWLLGQITGIQELLSGPVDTYTLKEAVRSLKDVIMKQGVLKHSLTEAKSTVKTMMLTFIDRLGAFASSTEEYQQKMGQYATKIQQAADITSLNHILDDVMQETRVAQTEALRSRDAVVAARKEAQDTDARIRSLQQELTRMSELVHEDQLTGSLNRRGMEDLLVREMARSDRQGGSFCVALLDLDDFKSLNDRYGHLAGDQALVHLVHVVKDTLRTMDVIARFGGEEFLIVLPDTAPEAAIQTITRVQRELTKRIFMHNNERILVTFSAGVALRKTGEAQPSMLRRADEALYKAKKAGKNRVIAAD